MTTNAFVIKDNWLTDFTWLRKYDNLYKLYCHVCRMFPQTEDTTSFLYIEKSLIRKDTLTSSHQMLFERVMLLMHVQIRVLAKPQ
jgi:hypothetical protein